MLYMTFNSPTSFCMSFVHNLKVEIFEYFPRFKNSIFFSDTPRSKSYQINRRANQTSHSRATSSHVTIEHDSLHDFLSQHIDQAFGKGFDDNVGRNPVPSVFHVSVAPAELTSIPYMYISPSKRL